MAKELFPLLVVQHIPPDGLDLDNSEDDVIANVFYFVYNISYEKLKRDKKIGITNHKNYFVEKVNEILLTNKTEEFSEGWFAYTTAWASVTNKGILDSGCYITVEPFSGTKEELMTYLGYNKRKDMAYVFESFNLYN